MLIINIICPLQEPLGLVCLGGFAIVLPDIRRWMRYCVILVKGTDSGFRLLRLESGFNSYHLFKISCKILNLRLNFASLEWGGDDNSAL